MVMDVIQNNGVCVVVPGVVRLDASQAAGFRDSLKKAVDLSGGHLILDLDTVTLIDSTILGVVVGVFRDLPEHGRLVLCEVGQNVGSLLKLTHLDKIFSTFGTREEALTALR